jgi:hypothetical protein
MGALLRLLTWPFRLVWHLVWFILGLTGRLVAGILGAVLILAGVIVSLTVVGLIVGIPLIIFGVLLIVASLS